MKQGYSETEGKCYPLFFACKNDSLDIRIDDNPLLTVADMNAKCRRIENLGLVVIDYLQFSNS